MTFSEHTRSDFITSDSASILKSLLIEYGRNGYNSGMKTTTYLLLTTELKLSNCHLLKLLLKMLLFMLILLFVAS